MQSETKLIKINPRSQANEDCAMVFIKLIEVGVNSRFHMFHIS